MTQNGLQPSRRTLTALACISASFSHVFSLPRSGVTLPHTILPDGKIEENEEQCWQDIQFLEEKSFQSTHLWQTQIHFSIRCMQDNSSLQNLKLLNSDVDLLERNYYSSLSNFLELYFYTIKNLSNSKLHHFCALYLRYSYFQQS